jgi:hypothetical protein
MPPLLIVLSLLAVAMIVVALGVMFDALPAWSTRVESPAHRLVVMPNRILPILSSIVGIVFVTTIFRRYAQRGGTHLFVWGIGLAFFATGSMTESLHGLLGWNAWVFRVWYLFGAVLIAAGAILGGGASAFARFGMLSYLYLAELSSLILVFVGFLIATRSVPTRRPSHVA